MTTTISRYTVALVAAALLAAPLALLAYDAGNDAVNRTHTDSYENFTIVDTNNPFDYDGVVESVEYYAANTNPFRILIVDGSDMVTWVSDEVTPVVGVGTINPNPMPAVSAGDNLAIYSASTGVIPHDKVGDAAEYTANNDGLPVVGDTLSYAGDTDRTYSVNATVYTPSGAIVAPEADEVVYGMVDLVATYDDGDDEGDDAVNWAVRAGACDGGTNVAGNVGAFVPPANTAYEWDGTDFSATVDTAGWAPGMYCFVFNPTDDGPVDVRETQEFYVASEYVNGGGQILETEGLKRKDWKKVSFGGWFANIGELVGSLEVNFHNVGDNAMDKTKFHGVEVSDLNLFAPSDDTCTAAMNATVHGSFEGEDGYTMIIRGGDSSQPASMALPYDDTIRFTLMDPDNNVMYDTHNVGEFTDEASCVGSARTGLDNGNLTIVDNS